MSIIQLREITKVYRTDDRNCEVHVDSIQFQLYSSDKEHSPNPRSQRLFKKLT